MLKILLVEDDPGIAMAIEDDLRAEGYAVEVVTDGDDRVDARSGGRPSTRFCSTSCCRRRTDSLSVATRARPASARPSFSSRRGPRSRTRFWASRSGADDYITKPYSPGELRARIKAVLRRSTEAVPEVFRLATSKSTSAGTSSAATARPVATTPLEFKLLETFVRHRGRALGRQRLIDEAWGRDTFVTDRVVDNQVTNLRKKIEPTPSAPTFLHSIRGYGYRFDPS